jgi:RNA polymerase sigma-70 factor (ECF subfamily)
MPPPPPPHSADAASAAEESSWVAAAQAGDRAAFNRLMDLYQAPIYRLVFYRTRSQADAEDITQEVFLQALRHLPRLRETEKFKPWLFRIAINRIRDFTRRGRFRALFEPWLGSGQEETPQPEPAASDDPAAELERGEFWQRIGGALDRLPRMEREVLLLRFFEGLDMREISVTLGKSDSTVKTHLYRALRKFQADPSLREALTGEIP